MNALAGPSFVELATAWSTVAVAIFALVALFLPWRDRRHNRRLLDERLGRLANSLATQVASLAHEFTFQTDPPTTAWLKSVLPQLTEMRDRLFDLAAQAAGASPAVARGVARALTLVTHEAALIEMRSRVEALDGGGREPSDSGIRFSPELADAALTAAAEYLYGVANKESWEAVDRVRREWTEEALKRIQQAERSTLP